MIAIANKMGTYTGGSSATSTSSIVSKAFAIEGGTSKRREDVIIDKWVAVNSLDSRDNGSVSVVVAVVVGGGGGGGETSDARSCRVAAVGI
mmetsp:Transcript_12507/g.23479  ORF Transcript_12507/g.23479 Transcript_12507/m.23479 type:complete len:91 (+) Transcript_12507:836-1108(+)